MERFPLALSLPLKCCLANKSVSGFTKTRTTRTPFSFLFGSSWVPSIPSSSIYAAISPVYVPCCQLISAHSSRAQIRKFIYGTNV
ncbi:hypothetical protein QN277_027239 [Acacia crassicarpa]|uniref:Uncharacterized protein n=1 Tax=Acacia crassicarpa TaxID=499986 RepID=A0AAE1JDW2_9FABA|nr:hypothetical protein QN277_027239 [Acacia crassicarpa]